MEFYGFRDGDLVASIADGARGYVLVGLSQTMSWAQTKVVLAVELADGHSVVTAPVSDWALVARAV